MVLLGYLGWLLWCCYAVARVLRVVGMRLLGCSGWLVCMLVISVISVLLGSCYGTRAGC